MVILPILSYHIVDKIPSGTQHIGNYVLPEQFDAQLTAISSWGYVPITLEDWLDFQAKRRKPPRRPIAITFDDGYRSNHDIAWPLLRRHGMTANVFVVTDLIGGTNRWDLNVPKVPLLRPEEIHAMQATGILFGSHTCTHGSLIDMQLDEAFLELTRSRAKLMAFLGRPVVALAYPYNKQNSTLRALARQAGYQAAVLGRGRANSRWTDPLGLMRIAVDSSTTVEALGQRLFKSRWLAGL